MLVSLFAQSEVSVTRAEQALLRNAQTLQASDPAAAAAQLASGITPESSAALDMTAGQLYLLAAMPAQAIPHLEAALVKEPDFRQAREALVQAQWQLEKWAAAEQGLKALLADAPNDEARLLQLGYALLQQDRPVSAEVAYRNALLAGASESRQALIGLSRCLRQQERLNEARAVLRQLRDQSPGDAAVWQDWVGVHRQLRQDEETLIQLECQRRLGLGNPESDLLAAELLAAQGLPEAADARFAAALAAGELSESQVRRVADHALRQQRTDLLKQAATRLPAESQAVYLAGVARIEGRYEDAETAFRVVLRTEPLHGEAMIGLAETLMALGDLPAARDWFQRAAARPAVQSRGLYGLLQLAVSSNDMVGAVAVTDRLIRLEDRPALGAYRKRLIQLRDAP